MTEEIKDPVCPYCLTEKIKKVEIEIIEASIKTSTLDVNGKVVDDPKTKKVISITAHCPHCGYIVAHSIAGGMDFLKIYKTEAFVSKDLRKKIIYYTE